MKNLQLLLLCTLLSVLSCDKDDYKTVISGHVTTLGTEDPVVDAKVVLLGGVSDGNFSNPGAILYRIDSFYTDATGFYEFSFDASDYPVLDMVAEKESYFTKDVKQGLVSGKENVADIVMDPFAWLKLHMKNVMPSDVGDYISVDNPLGGGITPEPGINVDELYIIKLPGNREHNIYWQTITNENGTSSHSETLYFPAQDTTLLEIFF